MNGEEEVHRIRVELKRLRALWRLARAAQPDQAAAADRERIMLRDAGRQLAETRESQVLLRLLRKLQRSRSARMPAGHPKVRHTPVARNSHVEAARRQLATSTSAFAAFSPAGGPQAWIEALVKTYRRARRKIPASTRSADDTFHAWRKAVKDLMYPLELWPGLSPERRRKLVGKLDWLQQKLGLAHDLAVLEKAVQSRHGPIPSSLKPRGKDLRITLRHAARRKQALKEKTLDRGRRIFHRPPRKFRRQLLKSARRMETTRTFTLKEES